MAKQVAIHAIQATTATELTALSVCPAEKESMETTRICSRWRPRRASHVHKARTRLPRVQVKSRVATTAVLESTALNQALPALSLGACHVRQDGFKILKGTLLAELARTMPRPLKKV